MKIVHITHAMDPARGGPPSVVARQAAAQASLGHEVTIFSGVAPASDETIARSLRSIPGFERVRLLLRPLPHRISAVLRETSGERELIKELHGADFAQIHEVWPACVPIGARACRRAGQVPYCIMPHSSLNTWGMNQRRFKKRVALHLLGWKRALNGARWLHMLNRAEVEQAEPLKLSPPTEVIPNGVFLEELDPLPPRGAFRAKHPELGDQPYILFLSRLHYKKGLDHLAGAFRIVGKARPDVHLVVAGPDDGERAGIERLAGEHGLRGRVHLAGPIYGSDKFAAYVDAAVFCLPSRMEGFSVAITESLACGTPVVISRECNFPEVAEARAGIVTEALSAPSVAAGLTQLLGDETERRMAGARGQQLVRDRYTWPAIARRMIEMYERYGRG